MIGRIESKILEEWVYPVICGDNGQSVVAPTEAVELRDFLKGFWLKEYLPQGTEVPAVDMFPQTVKGRRVYVVRTKLQFYIPPVQTNNDRI